MTLARLLEELDRRGVALVAEGDRLRVRGARGALDPELLSAIRAHKPRLLEALRDAGASADGGGGAGPRPRPPGSPVVASVGQKRFWELQRLASAPTLYNVPGAFRLTGPLEVEVLRDALQRFVARHEVLRSRFRGGADGLEIDLGAPVEVALPVDDLSDVEEARRDQVLAAHLEACSDEPLDLAAGPPFSARLVRLGPEDHALLFVAHSLAWDGWSFDLLLTELKAHYEVGIGWPDADPVPEPTLQYADFAAWQQERLASGVLDRAMVHWRERLAGRIPSLGLPTDGAPGPSPDHAGARRWFRLDPDTVAAVRTLARAERTTPYAVLLAGFKVLLHRYSGVRDILVASPLYGRDRPEVEALVGVFANTLFLRSTVDPDATFRETVRRVHATTADAVEYQLAPTERVAELLRRDSPSRSPYEALFVYQQTARRPRRFGPVAVRSIERGTRRVAVDLTVWVREYEDYIDGAFDYRTALFAPETIEAMVQHVERLVGEAAARPDGPVGRLPLADDAERERIDGWQEAQRDALLAACPGSVGAAARSAAILDGDRRPTAINEEGEIHVEEAGGGGGWTGTGVRARWTARGEVRIVAREAGGEERAAGAQELARVAEVLRAHPDVEDATAVTQPVAGGDPRVVGYVVWNTSTPPFQSELRRHLAAHLPADLVPGVTVELESLPRDGRGVIREGGLPNPFGGDEAPELRRLGTATERAVAEVWLELLDVEAVGPDDNFFELGGHSLLAVEAVARLERRFDTRLEARDTFFRSLRQIAAAIDGATAPSRA